MILAGTRVNTLVHLKVTNMYITDTEVSFTFDEVHKHSQPNYKQKPLIFRVFTSRDLFPVTTLITYLEHRIPVSGDPALCITTVKPHKKASKDSISRWIKLTVSEAGINSGLFTSHSCRSAHKSGWMVAFSSFRSFLPHARVTSLQSFPWPYGYLHGKKNPLQVSLPSWYFCDLITKRYTEIGTYRQNDHHCDSFHESKAECCHELKRMHIITNFIYKEKLVTTNFKIFYF